MESIQTVGYYHKRGRSRHDARPTQRNLGIVMLSERSGTQKAVTM